MDLKELVRLYLSQKKVMQLATSVDNQPWAITVHFYSDDDFKLYWASKKTREHSKHIEKNNKTSATVMVHENTPSENFIMGLTFVGKTELLDRVPEDVGQAYIKKLDKDPVLIKNISNNIGDEGFYCLTPSRIVLFDTKNFPKNPRQEVRL